MLKRTNVIPVTICALATVLVQPALGTDHSQKGEWERPVLQWPLQAIHMVLMKNGKLLCLAQRSESPNIIVVDPSDPSNWTEPVQQPEDYFCSGHSQLGDAEGRILFAAGGVSRSGHHSAHTFDPDRLDLGQDPWKPMEDIAEPGGQRWYPTATTLGNGLVLLTAGRFSANSDDPAAEDIPALFNHDPPFSDPQWKRMAGSAEKVIHWYPFMFQLSSGRVFMGGGAYFSPDRDPPNPSIHLDTYNLDVASEQWTLVDRASEPGWSAVMYRPDKVMKASCGDRCTQKATNTVQVISLGTVIPPPAWTEVDSMNYSRAHFYLIPLPDGRVLAVGGQDESGGSVLAGEWYDPDEPSPLWKVLAPMSETRRYHSSAVLLPDARVLIGGGKFQGADQKTAEIFKPPYLFNNQNQDIGSDRPVITSAPDEVIYNTAFSVGTNAPDITEVSLIRLGAATHSFDMDTRFLRLQFTQIGSILSIAAPANGNIAPPGHYMLFILKPGDRAGIDYPSVARIVRLKSA